jgi:hypothetical protein
MSLRQPWNETPVTNGNKLIGINVQHEPSDKAVPNTRASGSHAMHPADSGDDIAPDSDMLVFEVHELL